MAAHLKTGIISRVDGLVVLVTDDRIVFDPVFVGPGPIRPPSGTFDYVDRQGARRQVDLAAGTLAFTVADVLVVAHRGGPPFITVILDDGSIRSQEGLTLDRETSAQILGAGGGVRRLDVYLGLARVT